MNSVPQPAISVVIPTLARPQELARAVRSVLAQTYSGHIEVLIVAIDSSPCLDIPESPNRSLRVVLASTPCSAGRARNLGVSHAAHDLVAFLDDDDQFRLQKLSRQVQRIDEFDAVFTGVRFHANGRIADHVPSLSSGLTYAAVTGEFFAVQTLLIRREAFGELGGFDPLLPKAEDQDFVMRIGRTLRVAVIPEPLVVVERGHTSRMTLDYGTGAIAFEILRRKHPHVYARYPEALLVAHTRLGWLAFGSGNRSSARYHACRALRMSLGCSSAWLLLASALMLPQRAFFVLLRMRRLRWRRGDP